MIQKVKFIPAQGQPQKWKMEASSELNCSSTSSWEVLAEGKSLKDPCPDEIQVITIPLEKAGMYFCYRMHFSGGELPADIQIWKRFTDSSKPDINYMYMTLLILDKKIAVYPDRC